MKHFTICVLLTISVGLFSQSEKPIEKGQLMLGGGGSLGYSIQIDDLETTTGTLRISIGPSVGFFVAHGFALGVAPSYSISTSFGDYTNTNSSLGMGVFLAKYFDIGIFVRGTIDYDYNWYNYEMIYYSDKNHSHTFSLIPEVGYAFFLGPNVALELALRDRLNMVLTPDEDATIYSQTSISVGFQIFL
ncbi:MAG: autotransporter outer membrane beta-barrel domain-containing protein [Bacteroidetes bacterium]|nr:autotransporter outer membrane beta-barrel domain-containing protein [Bacteroidota bacterium]